ncbi:DUF5958 family protein [Streptomyces sp. NPDC006516]|uniref:DUF5958 family protein n=1 Tax=Streptomyces sp. NPDC006516 TaxID=3154309 RepID=UPI0033BD75BD
MKREPFRTLDDGSSWFSGLPPAERQAVLREVGGYAMQAHITAADGQVGVARSGVKPTATPSVMICKDPPRYGFAALPADEHIKAFRVLVSVFSVADTRPGRHSAKAPADTHGTTCFPEARSRTDVACVMPVSPA